MMLLMKVNVEVVQRPVIFPSVTICNKNHLDTLVVDKLDSMFFDLADASTQATGDVLKFIQEYLAFADKWTAFLKHSENLSVMQYNYENPEVREHDYVTVCWVSFHPSERTICGLATVAGRLGRWVQWWAARGQ